MTTTVPFTEREQPTTVFLVAPSGRSGTNYLYHLLIQAGLCRAPSRGVAEDFLGHNADLLVEYAHRTTQRWHKWLAATQIEEWFMALSAAIGSGILAAFGEPIDASRPALFKSPSARNLLAARQVFPDAALILLIRDGRDVAESMLQSGFRRNFVTAAYRWSRQAEDVLRFLEKQKPAKGRLHVVHFEHLVRAPADELSVIAAFLGVEWDGGSAPELPAFGSSQVGTGQGFNWQISDRPTDFEPVARWARWGFLRRLLFHLLAGRQLIRFGSETNPRWWLQKHVPTQAGDGLE